MRVSLFYFQVDITTNEKKFERSAQLQYSNSTLTVSELEVGESFSLTLHFLASNGLNLTEPVFITGNTRNPELTVNAPEISDRQVRITWESNHEDIPSKKKVSWALYETGEIQGRINMILYIIFFHLRFFKTLNRF